MIEEINEIKITKWRRGFYGFFRKLCFVAQFYNKLRLSDPLLD